MERTTSGAVGVFDNTNPANASFVDIIVTTGTTRPEGLTTFVKDNMVFLAIANEGNGNAADTGMSTAIYALAPVPEPETWAMLLTGLGSAESARAAQTVYLSPTAHEKNRLRPVLFFVLFPGNMAAKEICSVRSG